jgi:hypothetical protein
MDKIAGKHISWGKFSLKPTDALLFAVMLKQIKIILCTPTCFDPHWDHPQGVLSVLS